MTHWGEVSYRVKRAIAFHERFTIAQLADSTGLIYEQVEQVVHRLVDRGNVRRLSPEELTKSEQEVEKRVGRPRARYILVEDPILRAEFLADLEAVAAAARLELASARRPDTPYYVAALKAVDAMEVGEEQVRFSRLKEVEKLLAYGREYEALIPEGLEVVQAYYDLALARLNTLGGEFAAAEWLLERTEATLAKAGLEEEMRRVTEWRSAVQVERVLNEVRVLLRCGNTPLPVLKQLQESLLHIADSPLCLSIHRVVELLTEVLGLIDPARNWAFRQTAEAVERLTRTIEARHRAESTIKEQEILDTKGYYGASELQHDPGLMVH
jgi:hypothetical protein